MASSRRSTYRFLAVVGLAHLVDSQTTTTTSPTPSTPSSTTTPLTSTPPPTTNPLTSTQRSTLTTNPVSPASNSTILPSHSDTAPGGNPHHSNSKGLVNYYFVFLAVILCVLAVTIFFFLRRRRSARLRMGRGRERALQRDLARGGRRRYMGRGEWMYWDGSARRYVHGRQMSSDAVPLEGLNEEGEAPPPYVPKPPAGGPPRETDTAENSGPVGEGGGLAVPLHTLSRGETALKPPDYTDSRSAEVRSPTRAASSSSRVQLGSPSRDGNAA